MLSKDLRSKMLEQINMEYYSAYLYLSMSLDAQFKNLNGIAKWLFVQWQEEQDHARILELYMLSQDEAVELLPIEEVPHEWKGVKYLFKEALKHEQKVTASIHQLMLQAVADKDYASVSRLEWFVNEQVEEEQAVRDILSSLELFGDEGVALYHLDELLGQRKYKQLEG